MATVSHTPTENTSSPFRAITDHSGGHQLRSIIEDYGARDADKSIDSVDVPLRDPPKHPLVLQTSSARRLQPSFWSTTSRLSTEKADLGNDKQTKREVYNPDTRPLLYSQ